MSPPCPRFVALADCAPRPWRNGGGLTRELLCGPGTGDWRWRLSVADIDADGPFSGFPGVQRWFTVAEGAGVELALPAGRVTLRPADAPLAFDGAAAPGCRLLDGPTRDLNLMLRGPGGRLETALPGTPWHAGTASAGLYAAAPGWLHAAGARWAVPAATLAWFDEAPAMLAFEPAAAAPVAGWWVAVETSREHP